jgi:hypothetical protein
VIWRQDCHALATEREPFGFKDGFGHPAVEGSGIAGTNSAEAPFKAGEFLLGYPDETGELPPMPKPDVLGRNGTTSCSASSTNGWRRSAPTCATTRAPRRSRSSSPRR